MKKLIVLALGAAVLAFAAAIALGSPGVGFHPENLVTANLPNDVKISNDRIKFQTKDPTDVRVQRIVIDPGGYSGWHHHPGIVIVSVLSGQVTFTNSDCSSTTYGPGLPAGSSFVESGDDPGQASSAGGATVYATFVAPSADPPLFRIDDTKPRCAP